MNNANINKIVIISSLLIMIIMSLTIKAQAMDFNEWTIKQKYNKTDPKWIVLNQFNESEIDSAKRKIMADLTMSNNNNVITSKAVAPRSTAVNESIIESKLFRTILFCEVFVLITALYDAVKNKRFYHVRIPFIIKIVIAIVKFAIMFVVTTFILHFMVLIAEVYNMQEYVILGVISGAILILIIWLVKVVYFTPFNMSVYNKIIDGVDGIAQASINRFAIHNPKWRCLLHGDFNYYFRYILFYMISIPTINSQCSNYISRNPDFANKLMCKFIKRFNKDIPYGYDKNSNLVFTESIIIGHDIMNLLYIDGDVNTPRMELPEALLAEFLHLCNLDPNEGEELYPLWVDIIAHITALYHNQ